MQKRGERIERANEAGEQIQLQHLEKVYGDQEKAQQELDARCLRSKVEGYIKTGLSQKEAEKKAKEELSQFQADRSKKENIKFDEDLIREGLKDQRATKREIKEAIRELRQSLKSS